MISYIVLEIKKIMCFLDFPHKWIHSHTVSILVYHTITQTSDVISYADCTAQYKMHVHAIICLEDHHYKDHSYKESVRFNRLKSKNENIPAISSWISPLLGVMPLILLQVNITCLARVFLGVPLCKLTSRKDALHSKEVRKHQY